MAELRRLQSFNPDADEEILIFSSPAAYICAVVAANKSSNLEARFSVWVMQEEPIPSGADLEPYRYYIIKDGILPPAGSYESWRFTMIADDTLYVKSNNGKVSFTVNGMNQSA